MMVWEVWFYDDGLENTMYVIANSFDEAIALARQFDSRYCMAQPVGKADA